MTSIGGGSGHLSGNHLNNLADWSTNHDVLSQHFGGNHPVVRVIAWITPCEGKNGVSEWLCWVGGPAYMGVGGPCYTGVGGGGYNGVGGPAYDGVGGPCYNGVVARHTMGSAAQHMTASQALVIEASVARHTMGRRRPWPVCLHV